MSFENTPGPGGPHDVAMGKQGTTPIRAIGPSDVQQLRQWFAPVQLLYQVSSTIQPAISTAISQISLPSGGGGGAGVTAVTATSPLTSTGGTTPNIALETFDPGIIAGTWTGGVVPSSYFTLNDPGLTTATDAMGGTAGTYTNGAFIVFQSRSIPARDSKPCAYFGTNAASNTFVTLPDNTTSATPFTLMLAFNVTGQYSNTTVPLSNYTGAAGYLNLFISTAGLLQVSFNGTGHNALAFLSNNTWHLAFIVFSALSGFQLWIDGAQVTFTAATVYTKGAAGWVIGNQVIGGPLPYQGWAGKFAQWGTTPLTQAQITIITQKFFGE